MSDKKVYSTIKEAEQAYKKYIDDHIKNVQVAFQKFKDIIYSEIIFKRSANYVDKEFLDDEVSILCEWHDQSKYDNFEFDPYRKHFYPSKEDDDDETDNEGEYERAWIHHYTVNRHHPEFWSFRNALNNTEAFIKMPDKYFVEMLCDWISVSITKKSSTFDWWYNSDGGQKEKATMLSEQDAQLIGDFITNHKEDLDFSDVVNG